jgi:MraZ protein
VAESGKMWRMSVCLWRISPSHSTMNLIGEYPVSMDDKGRLRIPASLLRQLPTPVSEESGFEFVVNRGFEKCLTMYPKTVWDSLSAKINRLNRFNNRNRMFIRAFYQGACHTATDSAGRILVQKPLLDYAGITNEALLLAMDDRIEIWAPDQYNNLVIDPEQFSDLSDQVLGGGDDGVGDMDFFDDKPF